MRPNTHKAARAVQHVLNHAQRCVQEHAIDDRKILFAVVQESTEYSLSQVVSPFSGAWALMDRCHSEKVGLFTIKTDRGGRRATHVHDIGDDLFVAFAICVREDYVAALDRRRLSGVMRAPQASTFPERLEFQAGTVPVLVVCSDAYHGVHRVPSAGEGR